jgi:hypothetical protein
LSYYILTDENHIVIYVSHIPKQYGLLNNYHEYPDYIGKRIPKIGDHFLPDVDIYSIRNN